MVGKSDLDLDLHNPRLETDTLSLTAVPDMNPGLPSFLPQLTRLLLSVTVPANMLMIRFQRIGRKNDPAFRMAVLEKTAGPKAGKYVDLVGTYNPKTKAMTVDGDRVKGWVAKGAQLSPSLKNLLISKGILEGKKVNVLPKKTRIVSEEEKAAAIAAAAPAPVIEEATAVVEETGEEVAVAEVVDAPEVVEAVVAEDASAA